MKKKAILGEAALLTAALIWGTSFVMLKETLDSVQTLWVMAIRFTLSSLLMLAFSIKRLKYINKRCVLGGFLLGLCLTAAYVVQTYGLVFTTPGKNAFLSASYCIMVPFLIWACYKRRPNRMHVIGAFLSICGIGFVSLVEGFDHINIGDVLTVICGFFYAMQIVLMEHYGIGNDPLCISLIQFGTGAVVCWIAALIFEPVPQNVPTSAWLSIAYMGLLCTGLCFYLEAWGLRYTPAPIASVLMSLESVFGALVSILFYDERLTIQTAMGFMLIFAAVIISQRAPRSAKEQGSNA